MVNITFSGTPLSFRASLTPGIGVWKGLALDADDASPPNVLLHLEQFTTSVLDVSASYLPSLVVSAEEVAGDPYLQMEVINRSGTPLTVSAAGGDIFTLPAGQTVLISYQRASALIELQP